MHDTSSRPPRSLAPMPCPAYLVAAHEEGGEWVASLHRVLFAQDDGESTRLLICHPAYGGLVSVDQVSSDHPALLIIDPTEEEREDACYIVRAKAVARAGAGSRARDEAGPAAGEAGRPGGRDRLAH